MTVRRLLALAVAPFAVTCASSESAPSAPSKSVALAAPVVANSSGSGVDTAFAALAAKTDRLAAFTANYRLQLPDGGIVSLRLSYLAPDSARLDATTATTSTSTWIGNGQLSTRGTIDGVANFADLPLEETVASESAFFAELAHEFPKWSGFGATGNPGPMFFLDLLPPEIPDEHGNLKFSASWSKYRSHLLAWLDVATTRGSWRSEGSDWVRGLSGGGSLRVSNETGFITSITHPAGLDLRLESVEFAANAARFDPPPPAAGAKDIAGEIRRIVVAGAIEARRQATFTAALQSWPDDVAGRDAFDQQSSRIFAELHRANCRSIDDGMAAATASMIADIVEWARNGSRRVESKEQRAAFEAELEKGRDGFKERVLAHAGHVTSAMKQPRLDPAELPSESLEPGRLESVTALERAAFLADYGDLVVTPALARLDAALQVAGIDR